MLVEERTSCTPAERAHPLEQLFVRLAARGQQQVRRRIAPANADDDHAETIGSKFLGKGLRLAEPAAHEVAAGGNGPLVVDRALARDQEVAMLARIHRMATYLA